MTSIGEGVGDGFSGRWCGRCWRMPGFGAEVGNHVGSDAGGGTALTDAAEEGGHGDANRGAYVDWEVGGDFREPFYIAGGGEVGKGIREELKFHGDAIEEFCFIFIKLGKDGVFVLECVFYGREVTVCGICALAPRAVGNDVIIEEIGFLKYGGELGSNGGIDEGIEVMEKRDGATVN